MRLKIKVHQTAVVLGIQLVLEPELYIVVSPFNRQQICIEIVIAAGILISGIRCFCKIHSFANFGGFWCLVRKADTHFMRKSIQFHSCFHFLNRWKIQNETSVAWLEANDERVAFIQSKKCAFVEPIKANLEFRMSQFHHRLRRREFALTHFQ